MSDPGTPQAGDVVVVVWDGAPRDLHDGGADDQELRGRVTRLLGVHTELAAWVLEGDRE